MPHLLQDSSLPLPQAIMDQATTELQCSRQYMSQFNQRMLVKETSRHVVNPWAYLPVLPTQLMREEAATTTRWLVVDSDLFNNLKTLINRTNSNNKMSLCKILTIQSTLVSFQWDLLTRKTLRGKAKEETINKLLMEWYRMVRCHLDPRTLGNQLTRRPSKMTTLPHQNRTKVLCSNLAAIKHKIWYLDQLLRLKSQDHQLLKVIIMDTQLQLEVDRDHQGHLTTSRINSMRSMVEEWASKEMARLLMVNQETPKESSLKSSKTSMQEEQPSTIKQIIPII